MTAVEPVTSKLKTLGPLNPETIKAAEFSAASAKQESGMVARHQCTSVRGGNDCRSDRQVPA